MSKFVRKTTVNLLYGLKKDQEFSEVLGSGASTGSSTIFLALAGGKWQSAGSELNYNHELNRGSASRSGLNFCKIG